MSGPDYPSQHTRGPRRGPVLAGFAAALVLLVAAVWLLYRALSPDPDAPVDQADDVDPTGETTEVTVSAVEMDYDVDTIEVPTGDRLVITVVNEGTMEHDLVLEGGTRTDMLAPGQQDTIDVGVIEADQEGWCSVRGHREAGMELDVVAVD